MEPTDQLLDRLYRDKVELARNMSPEDKLLAGPRLFDQVCRVMLDGIRAEFPEASPAKHDEILRERLALQRRLEQSG
jgi:hypothetical protein